MGFIIIIGAIKDKVVAFFVITALFICCFHHFFVLSQSQRDSKRQMPRIFNHIG